MQEEIEQKTFNIMISTTKLSARTVLRAVKAAIRLYLDLKELRRMAYLLQMCSNNLNQYAKRANECGKVYAADMEDLRQRLDELIDIGKQILFKLAEL